MERRENRKRRKWTLVGFLNVTGTISFCLTICAFVYGCVADGSRDSLTLYCAHDLPFVESLVAEFETETGIDVAIVADTEATKSLGLVRRIVAEKDAPQADVFWNNQLLGTLELAEQDLLAPLAVPNVQRIPDAHRGETWAGFGA